MRGGIPCRVSGPAVLALAMIAAVWSPPASAQEVDLGLRVYKQKAQCLLCHGWAGDGDGAMDNPAPSLRVSTLDRNGVAETIRCGRPGTGMPYHFRAAYTNNAATSCFGLTEAELGGQKPNATRAFLTEAEISAVADYVQAWVLGRGKPTRVECEFFFGAGAASCAPYRN